MSTETSGSLRLFFALWPDDSTRNALRALQGSMQGRLTSYTNLHVTLAFLGQQTATLLPALKEVLARLPRTEIMLTLDRVGYFPRNRIAWAGMHEVPQALLDLHRSLIDALAGHEVQCGDQHSYTPHVTLARDATLPPDLIFTPIQWRARHVALVQSDTRQEGVHYEVLALRALDEMVRLPDPGEDARLP